MKIFIPEYTDPFFKIFDDLNYRFFLNTLLSPGSWVRINPERLMLYGTYEMATKNLAHVKVKSLI